MKSVLLSILLFAISIFFFQCKNVEDSPHAKKMVLEVSNIIESKSLFSGSLNWNQIDDSLSLLPFGKVDSTNNQLIFNFFINKLRKAGDKHSFFLTKRQIESYVKENPKPKLPEGKYLGNGIGLIKIPGLLDLVSTNITGRDFANNIRSQIKKIDTHNEINSWIVDLRGNTGGDMWPMLAGLNALMNDGIVGYFVGRKNQKDIVWESENRKIAFTGEFIDAYKVTKIPLKIAILIDSMTASSGEMTAISFIGLSSVKVFGQPSAGFTTANTTFSLSDGTLLNLATLNVADRTHKIYPDNIIPDVIVNIHTGSHIDETLEIAKNWLIKIDNK